MTIFDELIEVKGIYHLLHIHTCGYDKTLFQYFRGNEFHPINDSESRYIELAKYGSICSRVVVVSQKRATRKNRNFD